MLSRSNSHLTAYGKKRLFAQLAQRKQASPLLWSNITGCTFRSSCFTTSQVTAIKQSDCHKQQSSCLLRQILAIHSISALCAPTYTLNARPRPHQHSYSHIYRVGQNRIYTPYMTVYFVISLPKIPFIHRICMVLANPTYLHPRPHPPPRPHPRPRPRPCPHIHSHSAACFISTLTRKHTHEHARPRPHAPSHHYPQYLLHLQQVVVHQVLLQVQGNFGGLQQRHQYILEDCRLY